LTRAGGPRQPPGLVTVANGDLRYRLTQEEIAEALGVTRQAVSYNSTTIAKFCDSCKVDLRYKLKPAQRAGVVGLIDNHGYQTPATESRTRELVPLLAAIFDFFE